MLVLQSAAASKRLPSIVLELKDASTGKRLPCIVLQLKNAATSKWLPGIVLESEDLFLCGEGLHFDDGWFVGGA